MNPYGLCQYVEWKYYLKNETVDMEKEIFEVYCASFFEPHNSGRAFAMSFLQDPAVTPETMSSRC